MSNTQHTPGPWVRHGIARGTNPELAIVRERIAGKDGVTVAEIEYRYTTGTGNARLMCAAPELLASVEVLAEIARTQLDPEHVMHRRIDWRTILADAEALIKKAEGVAP